MRQGQSAGQTATNVKNYKSATNEVSDAIIGEDDRIQISTKSKLAQSSMLPGKRRNFVAKDSHYDGSLSLNEVTRRQIRNVPNDVVAADGNDLLSSTHVSPIRNGGIYEYGSKLDGTAENRENTKTNFKIKWSENGNKTYREQNRTLSRKTDKDDKDTSYKSTNILNSNMRQQQDGK